MDPVTWWIVLGIAVGIAIGEIVTLVFRRRQEEPEGDPTLGLKLTHAETEVSNWKQKYFDIQAESSRKAELTGRLEEEADRLRREHADQSALIMGLRAELTTAPNQTELAEIRNQFEAARAEVSRLTADVERQSGELADTRHQLMAAQDEGARLQNEVEHLAHVLEEAQEASQELSKVKAEAETLRNAEEERQKLAEELASEKQRAGALDAEIVAAAEVSSQLDEARRLAEAARQELEEREAALATLQGELEDARAMAREADSAHERTAGLEHELAELKDRLTSAESEREDLKAEAEALRQEVEINKEKIREAQELRSQAETLQRDVESLRLVSASKDQAVAESIENLRKIEAQLAYRPTAEEVERLQAELDARRSTIAELQEQIERTLPLSEDPMVPAPEPSLSAEDPQKSWNEPQDDETEPVSVSSTEPEQEPYFASETEPETEHPVEESTVAPEPFRPVAPVSSPPGRDALIQIIGIGHLYERKLRDAGIQSFADLASVTPERILEIIQPAEWQRIEPERWIEEAARLSAGAFR